MDIVCPPGTDITQYLGKFGQEYGFTGAEEIERISRTGVPKSHAEYHYDVSYPSGHPTDKILLDVLYEDIHYNQVVNLPITSPLLIQDGAPVMVQCPSLADMLGDKLTAFAPHTTGIPFFKHEDPFFMENMKQLYDISSILDRTEFSYYADGGRRPHRGPVPKQAQPHQEDQSGSLLLLPRAGETSIIKHSLYSSPLRYPCRTRSSRLWTWLV